MTKRSLPIHRLSDRHIGVTEAVALGYFEAACVCLDRHHGSPQGFVVVDNEQSQEVEVEWPSSDLRARNAWANQDDATEAGGYCLALANAELTRGLVAVSRARTRTGVDYYLGPPGSTPEDLETSMRLEVSGSDEGSHSALNTRLRQKMEQAARGESNLPALATVVGFAARRIQSSDVKSK
ncbi:MAG: hypothetical protein KDJ45_08775 [Hyphomicrobiaceae bacterium]|nr:hypothetical protein [Hyphomicrobiaceae bacterium]